MLMTMTPLVALLLPAAPSPVATALALVDATLIGAAFLATTAA